MLPALTPLALTLFRPHTWLNGQESNDVLRAIASGEWRAALEAADAEWPGGVLHHVLLNTATAVPQNFSVSAIDSSRRYALVAALLQGGVRGAARPDGHLPAPAYNLDPRLAGWVAQASVDSDAARVGREMVLAQDWVETVWSPTLDPAERWLEKHGMSWTSLLGGMPLWAHAQLSSEIKGLSREKQNWESSLPGMGSLQATPKEESAKALAIKERSKALRSHAGFLSPEWFLFERSSRKALRRSPERYAELLPRMWTIRPSSALYLEVVSKLQMGWLNRLADSSLLPSWEQRFEVWSQRWPTRESQLETVENPNGTSPLFGTPEPETVLALKQDPAWVQQWLAMHVVSWTNDGIAQERGLKSLRALSAAHPYLPHWKKVLGSALKTVPQRPNLIDVNAFRALEMECQLPDVAPVSAPRPRF